MCLVFNFKQLKIIDTDIDINIG